LFTPQGYVKVRAKLPRKVKPKWIDDVPKDDAARYKKNSKKETRSGQSHREEGKAGGKCNRARF